MLPYLKIQKWLWASLNHAYFSDATTHLYKRSWPSVSRSVCPSVRPSVRPSVCPVLFSNDECGHFWDLKFIKWHQKQWYDDWRCSSRIWCSPMVLGCLKKAIFTLFNVIVRPWNHQKWIPREILHKIHYLANFPMPFLKVLPVIPFSLELLKSWQNPKPLLSIPEVVEIGEKPNPVNIKWSKLYLKTIIITF